MWVQVLNGFCFGIGIGIGGLCIGIVFNWNKHKKPDPGVTELQERNHISRRQVAALDAMQESSEQQTMALENIAENLAIISAVMVDDTDDEDDEDSEEDEYLDRP